jgi:hypothetical protein
MLKSAYENKIDELSRHNQELEGIAKDKLTKPGNPAHVHEPGEGIFQFNPETQKWEESVKFPKKSSRTPFKSSLDKDGNEVVSGDPTDPDFQNYVSTVRAKKQAAETQSTFEAQKESYQNKWHPIDALRSTVTGWTPPQLVAPTNAAPAALPSGVPAPRGTPLIPQVSPTADTQTSPYKVGGRYGDLRYKGGDPSDETNWEPVK